MPPSSPAGHSDTPAATAETTGGNRIADPDGVKKNRI